MNPGVQATNPSSRAVPEGRISFRHYVLVGIQLALLTLLLRQFQIENAAFLRLAILAFAGFAVHALLPLRFRLPFFVVLSLAGIVLVMNPGNALWVIAIGLGLIAICHLPIPFAWRIALLIVAAAAMVALRSRWIEGPVPHAIWPILGSMFMFRLIVYLYDLRHDPTLASPARTLAYFFMLPNACFPMFPVVDSSAFRRNYFDDDAYAIYQKGIDWMVRGVIHLLLYRYIYYDMALAATEVTGPDTLIQYLITNFLLYLRVSGLFHLIVGMLYLFGFRLPETHNKYILASSFTDYWRRINIYWKDFMQKVFYYPAMFRLKSLGLTRAMILATVWVFVATWALHAYQWYWLRGTLFVVAQDMLFWGALAVFVIINGLYELHYGRKRRLTAATPTWRDVALRAAKAYAMFWFICVLWSFWTAESVTDWLSLWSALRGDLSLQGLVLPAIILLIIALGCIERTPGQEQTAEPMRRSFAIAPVVTVVSMVVLIAVSREEVNARFGPEVATTIHSLRSGALSRLDNAKLERGYYENLLAVSRFNSQLWEVYSKKPAQWLDVRDAGLKRFTGDFAQTELIPSFVAQTSFGSISVNRWGMRDRDYEPIPGAGTFRAAVLGPSTVMGWGTPDGETFEALFEARLNHERAGAPYVRYEVLNLGVPGYQPPQQLVALEKALRFQADAVFYIAGGREGSRTANYLAEVVHKGIDIPYAPLAEVLRKAGVTTGMDEASAVRRLSPYRTDLLAGTYAQIAARTRATGAVPVLVFLPQVRAGTPEDPWEEETPATLKTAADAGFIVIDLNDVFAGQDISTIRLAEWDEHPNAYAHKLIADRLFAAVAARTDIIRPIANTRRESAALQTRPASP